MLDLTPPPRFAENRVFSASEGGLIVKMLRIVVPQALGGCAVDSCLNFFLRIVASAFQVGNPSFSHWDELLCRHDSTLADLKRYANASFHLSLCLRDWSKGNTKTRSNEALAVGIEKTPYISGTSV